MSHTKTSKFIPNSFQHPNAYIDEFHHLLTSDEVKVLDYAIRRILGFNKRADRIALSQFCNGLSDEDGNPLDHGTGLNEQTVRKCIGNLVRFGLMIRASENDPVRNEGVLWSLQLDSNQIDLDELKKRLVGINKLNKSRIRDARKSKVVLSDNTTSDATTPPIVAQQGGGGMPQQGGGVVAQDTQYPVETQRKHSLNSAAPREPRPRDLLFEELADITNLTPPARDWKQLTRTAAGQLNRYTKELREVGATPEQIQGFLPWFKKTDWRGKGGQFPAPADVVKGWMAYRKSLNGEGNGSRGDNHQQLTPEQLANRQRVADQVNANNARRAEELAREKAARASGSRVQ